MIDKKICEDNAAQLDFNQALVLSKQYMSDVLSSSPSIIRPQMDHLQSSKGKFLRSAALIACAFNKEGTVGCNAAMLGAAIELTHLATLVHDDVIDDSATRRGKLSLQKKFGQKTAVICGDYLLCRAMMLSSEAYQKSNNQNADLNLPSYLQRLCIGELEELENTGCLELSVKKYLKIIKGKTAALFEAAFHAGALIGGEADLAKKYAKIGYYVGMMFQLLDDCADIESTTKAQGKPVLADFNQGVITLPLIYTQHNDKDFKDKMHSGIKADEIKKLVIKSGGVNFTKQIAHRYFTKAVLLLENLEIANEKKSIIKSVMINAAAKA